MELSKRGKEYYEEVLDRLIIARNKAISGKHPSLWTVSERITADNLGFHCNAISDILYIPEKRG